MKLGLETNKYEYVYLAEGDMKTYLTGCDEIYLAPLTLFSILTDMNNLIGEDDEK